MTSQPGAGTSIDSEVEGQRVRQTSTIPPDLLVQKADTRLSIQSRELEIDLLAAEHVDVGGVPFAVTTFTGAIAWIRTPALPGTATAVRLANAYCVSEANRNPSYGSLLRQTGLNLPDGHPVHWFMRSTAAGKAAERVRGPSLFRASLAAEDGRSTRHYFLGGSPETMEHLLAAISTDFPNAQVAGSFSPPFAPPTPQDLQLWSDEIRKSGATLVWVGLGTPKQDFIATELAALTGLHCVGVGAAFDFVAGTQREAPVWIQRASLEWLFRLVSEPRRLWRRYLIGNVYFVVKVLSHRLTAKRDR